MIWVSFIALIILILSFIGGLKEGAIKTLFSLVILLIAIPVTGASYRLLAGIISFLPGDNWENFIAFFIILAIVSVILHFISFLPRKLIQKVWNKGFIYRITGGIINTLNSAIGITLFAFVLLAFPIFGWLERAVAGSGVINWLTTVFGFIKALLPEIFNSATMVVIPILSSTT